jgi:hypothetical protein
MADNIHVTTLQVSICTGILLAADVSLALLVRRFISREDFRHLRFTLAGVAGIFFFLVWAGAMAWAWDWFYSYIFPAWMRYTLPLVFGVGYGLLSLGMAWLCLRLPGNPALTWIVLGSVEGLLSHLYAIYGLGAASKPPIMQGTDPMAVLIFAIFEKAFYWSLILLVSRAILILRRPDFG